MNFRQVFSICLLAFGGLVACVAADEPLSMKIEMRHGPNGPKRTAVVDPGERVCLSLSLSGLKQDEEGKFKLRIKGELRNELGELLVDMGKSDAEFPSFVSKTRMTMTSELSIPREQTKGKVKATFVFTDRVSGNKIEQEFPMEVREPTGAYPLVVGYWLAGEGTAVPASGKFTTGDKVFVKFWITGIKSAKDVHCKLEFFRKGESTAISMQEVATEVAANYRALDAMQGVFMFAATDSLDGFVRLTVTDDAGNHNCVEMPLVVTESLDSDAATYVAEAPKKSAAEPKKK
jgi:hypothetical protein